MRKSVVFLCTLVLGFVLSLPPAAAASPGVFGVVLDPFGRPIGGAEVELYRLRAGLVTLLTTGADGAFRLDAAGPEGTLWQMRVWAKGYRSQETGWFDVSQERYHSMRLRRLTGALLLSARDTKGAPVEGMLTLMGPVDKLVGEFKIEGGQHQQPELEPGEYRAIVAAPGFTPEVRSLTIAADQVATALVTLQHSGFHVASDVGDAVTNAPIPGASVELLRADLSRVAQDAAGAGGRFRLPALQEPAGSYRLWVTAAGYRSTLTEPITVVEGQEYTLSGGGAVSLQPLTGTLNGTLLNSFGTPVPESRVALALQGYGEIAEMKTDLQGNFRFERLPAGADNRYALFAPDVWEKFIPIWRSVPAGSTAQAIIQGQDNASETFGNGGASGIVTTPSGAPIQGAKVQLMRNSRLITEVETDSTGAFAMSVIASTQDSIHAADPYEIRISKEGFTPTREITVAGKPQTEVHVAQSRVNVEAVLYPRTANVQGRVVDGDGHPLNGAQVTLLSDGQGEKVTGATDASGWYELKNIALRPAAHYTLQAEAKGYLPMTGLEVTGAVNKLQPLPAARLTAEGATVTGQVVGPLGQPVGQVNVLLRTSAGQIIGDAVTDVAGFYRITSALPRTGLLTLTASKSGWTRGLVALSQVPNPGPTVAQVPSPGSTVAQAPNPGSTVAQVPNPGSTVTQNISIRQNTGVLGGRVLRPDGTAVAGAPVELLEDGNGVSQQTKTDAAGYFTFQDVSVEGWFSLRVRPGEGTFAGSLTHGTDLVPLLRLSSGEPSVVDLLVKP